MWNHLYFVEQNRNWNLVTCNVYDQSHSLWNVNSLLPANPSVPY